MKLLHDDNYENNEIIDNMILRHGSAFNEVIKDPNLNKDYTNMYNTITRTDDKTIDTKFTHLSFIGLNEMVMDEKYTMI